MPGKSIQVKIDFRVCGFCERIIRGVEGYAEKCPYCGKANKIVISKEFKKKYCKEKPKDLGVLIRGEGYHKRESNSDLRKWFNKPVTKGRGGRVLHEQG